MEVGYVEEFQKNLMPCQPWCDTGMHFTSEKYTTVETKLKYNGKMAIMCPICFNYVIIDNYTDMYTSMNPANIPSSNVQVYTMNIDVNYKGVCKNDKDERFRNFIKVDPNIAEIIKVLNNKGWRTEYCCESHPEEVIFDGYISFKPKLPEYILNTLPISWYHDTRTISKHEIPYYTIIRMCSEMEDCKGICLAELLDWAKNLPKNHYYIKNKRHKEEE